jgi:hypothetical protein
MKFKKEDGGLLARVLYVDTECMCLYKRLDWPQRQSERGGEEQNRSQCRVVLKSELCWSIWYCSVRENSYIQH